MSEKKILRNVLTDEITRVTEILAHYQQIGPADAFGAMTNKASLDRAPRALAGDDIVAMVVAMNDLKEYSE